MFISPTMVSWYHMYHSSKGFKRQERSDMDYCPTNVFGLASYFNKINNDVRVAQQSSGMIVGLRGASVLGKMVLLFLLLYSTSIHQSCGMFRPKRVSATCTAGRNGCHGHHGILKGRLEKQIALFVWDTIRTQILTPSHTMPFSGTLIPRLRKIHSSCMDKTHWPRLALMAALKASEAS